MTGDVLPCFDATTMILPDDACCIITVPITLDIATNHGVVVAAKDGIASEKYSLCLVDNLLQKPTMEELLETRSKWTEQTMMIELVGCKWYTSN